jgi:2',3'-cyclic-nucleotide 2'-phosphodiesterase (5'-nucleotidase family)
MMSVLFQCTLFYNQYEGEAQAFNAPLGELHNQLVNAAAVDLIGERASCRFEEYSNMGKLTTDAVPWKTAAEGTQIAFQNGGAIRASIPAGDVRSKLGCCRPRPRLALDDRLTRDA